MQDKPTAHRPPQDAKVLKKLQPTQAGAQRWRALYGDQLLCVRYRHDPTRDQRLVTVELLVEARPSRRRTPVPRSAGPQDPVLVQIRYGEAQLAAQAKANGARWDAQARLWRMTREQAERAGLTARIRTAE
ncbi:hypothetical protein [Ideonella livida]|uniref:Uncharacterized protein n=1 Tax=Ideonella livida TaxID=2707176 RepID=A0A7C9PL03_9BURK|nr:hypothetical protein [Ideonella livida]NDY93914.1 hypothetical protein [Ideonella livida]